MKIKKVSAKEVKNSRKEKTIQITVKTPKGKFITSAPSGKSVGKFEVKSYARSLKRDIDYINNLNINKINKLKLEKFEGLTKVEKMVQGKIGANSLFALEASILKGLAREDEKELWEFLGVRKNKINIRPVGNAIGGGLHSKGIKNKKPDFQEFLFVAKGKDFKESVKINNIAYKITKKLLKAKKRNDEGAWETGLNNEEVLRVIRKVRDAMEVKDLRVDIGLDVAASGFYKNRRYYYKNPFCKRSKREQIKYLKELINNFKIFYIEDGLDENDFDGFKELNKKIRGCLIVGDDLTVTNLNRVKRAVKFRAVSGIIVKPNQIGSLLEVKEVVDFCKSRGIKTIMSHRSGETVDDTIADLAVGFGVDFIKTGIYGRERRSKLKRLVRIEKAS